MVDTLTKKRKVSKKRKIAWRKHINIKDVDKFFENERLEERLGGSFSLKKDEELFAVDKTRGDDALNENNCLTKQQRRELLNKKEPRCFAILKPHSAVPDPITKRNRVKTPEERKSSIRKDIEAKYKKSTKKEKLVKKKRESKPKRGEFNVDVWDQQPILEPELKSQWLTSDTVRHTLTNTGRKRKRVPESLHKKPSELPAIIAPHPGTSYNPSFSDHQKLLAEVAAEEIKLIKEEEHLNRVTNKMFRKVSAQQKEEDNVKEMSEGLPLYKEEDVSDDEDKDPNLKSINPPVKNEKKTLVQRRKQKEQRKLEQERVKQKIEKRKVADIYHLNQLQKQISKKQKKEEILKAKRLKLQSKKSLEPKVLSRNKFEPLEQEFQMGEELSGNLRNAQPVGNLLKDRFKSLQQRNILAPSTLVLKKNKGKVKRYIKSDHKIDLKKVAKK